MTNKPMIGMGAGKNIMEVIMVLEALDITADMIVPIGGITSMEVTIIGVTDTTGAMIGIGAITKVTITVIKLLGGMPGITTRIMSGAMLIATIDELQGAGGYA